MGDQGARFSFSWKLNCIPFGLGDSGLLFFRRQRDFGLGDLCPGLFDGEFVIATFNSEEQVPFPEGPTGNQALRNPLNLAADLWRQVDLFVVVIRFPVAKTVT